MEIDRVFVPGAESEFIGMSRSPTGKLFRKQILRYGDYAHPTIKGEKLSVNQDVATRIVDNFRSGVCPIVQIPVVDNENRHSEDPFRNIGEVVDLTVEKDGVYGVLDVRKEEYAAELGKTLLGASAMMHMNYTDTKSGSKVGPTLLHVAITNRPYITDLDDFQEVVAASVADSNDDEVPVVLTPSTEGPQSMNKDELIAALKSDHGIDVEALIEDRQKPPEPDLKALSAALSEKGIQLSSKDKDDDEITVTDVAEAVVELSQEREQMASTLDELRKASDDLREASVTKEIEGYIQGGRVLPKQKEAMVKLAMTDRETFEALLPEDSIVELSERGVETHDAPDESEKTEKLNEEIARLSAVASEQIAGRRKGE